MNVRKLFYASASVLVLRRLKHKTLSWRLTPKRKVRKSPRPCMVCSLKTSTMELMADYT